MKNYPKLNRKVILDHHGGKATARTVAEHTGINPTTVGGHLRLEHGVGTEKLRAAYVKAYGPEVIPDRPYERVVEDSIDPILDILAVMELYHRASENRRAAVRLILEDA